MPPMACSVSFDDEHGTTHRVTVIAHSLYEAVGLAVKAFRAQPWTPPVPFAAPLTVTVAPPTVEHRVSIQTVRQWAAASARSPADRLQRERVRTLLAST